MGKSFIRPAISGVCALGGGWSVVPRAPRSCLQDTYWPRSAVMVKQPTRRGPDFSVETRGQLNVGEYTIHGSRWSLYYPLDIQILREKVFMVCFWGPKTFSGVDWMSRDQCTIKGKSVLTSTLFSWTTSDITLPENNNLAMELLGWLVILLQVLGKNISIRFPF